MSLLLTHPDIDVNAINNSGKTPLDIIIEKCTGLYYSVWLNSIIKLFTKHGAKRSAELVPTDI